MFKPSSVFLLTVPRPWWILYVICVPCLSCCLVFSLQPCGHLLVKGWLLGSLVMFSCIIVTFPNGVFGQVWYLIVSIPDLYFLPTLLILIKPSIYVKVSLSKHSVLNYISIKQFGLGSGFSLSDTEHTAYTVGHPCKPYIQPNQPWPYPSYTRAIRVYPLKPCMIFKTF